MVKIHCDRCGKEIKDEYYTINFNKKSINVSVSYSTTHVVGLSGDRREDMLRALNSERMYCEKCKNEIQEFINRK